MRISLGIAPIIVLAGAAMSAFAFYRRHKSELYRREVLDSYEAVRNLESNLDNLVNRRI